VFNPDPLKGTVGVVGAGTMGRGIAQVCATAGYTVVIFDVVSGVAKDGLNFIQKILYRSADKGRITEGEASTALGRITLANSLGDMADCVIILEATAENYDIKKDLFRQLDDIVSNTTVFATNTSSLSVTKIAAATRFPDRVVGLHFFNPPPLMALVEIVYILKNNTQLINNIVRFVTRLGKTAIRVKDSPGFIVNHIGRALITEAFAVLGEGVAEATDIDRVLRDNLDFKMGPFELLDLTGLDISHPVTEQIFDQFYNDPFYRPSEISEVRVAGGVTGRKTGGGFYRYNNNKAVIPVEPNSPSILKVPSIWIDPRASDNLKMVLAEAGANLVEKSKAEISIVTPIGCDATTTSVEMGLDAERTVAVDEFTGILKRRVVMTTPVTNKLARDAVWGLLAADGTPVTVIEDSVGFISQRVIAMIINLGCQVAAKGIASPTDIDIAVKLGLNYPYGPLEWGDRLGASTIVRILDGLFDLMHDPRYRVCPWLRRRALLGVSLLTPNVL
jgi:3-hydroxybutyryl-CoA dehydrogenase